MSAPCPECDIYPMRAATDRPACRLHAASPELLGALRRIMDMEREPYKAFPADWREQIAACAECERWKHHPIQLGICDQHRKPLYARERWDEDEQKRLIYRAQAIAREAIRKAETT